MSWTDTLQLVPKRMLHAAAIGAVVLLWIQFARGDALVCSNGAIFAKSCPPTPIAVGVPESAVVAFNVAECPSGWQEYSRAHGRFVVGIGRHSEFDQYGVELAELQLRATGGSRTHRLTVPEMPAHEHEYMYSTGHDSPEHTDRTYSEFGRKDVPDQPTKPTGGDEPHNNMPPFIALRFCELVGSPLP